MSNQETPPDNCQPKLAEEEVNHNGNQLVHRAVVTLGPSFQKIRRSLRAEHIARQFTETHSLPISPPRPKVSLPLVSRKAPECREEDDVPGGC
jgi:hypothetical protein